MARFPNVDLELTDQEPSREGLGDGIPALKYCKLPYRQPMFQLNVMAHHPMAQTWTHQQKHPL